MTWHQWHQTAEMLSRIGLSLVRASSKAAASQGRQLISAARFGRGEKWKSLMGYGLSLKAGLTGPWPLPISIEARMAPVTKFFASWTASTRLMPLASSAAMAGEKTQPLPGV